jgi:uncharacterized protein YbjT (DUF2867 family)
MHLLIIGASGATGHFLVRDTVARGHTVTAFVRNPAAFTAPASVRVAQGDVRDAEALASALEGQEAVLSAFGPRSLKNTGIQELQMRHLVAGMEAKGVRRLVNLSGLGVGDSAPLGSWFERKLLRPLLLKDLFVDKTKGEAILFASGLDYVNVRPGRLLNSPARGGVKANLDGRGLAWTMTREDLAAFMVAQVDSDAWLGKTVLLGY